MNEHRLSRRGFLLLSTGTAVAGALLAACQPQVVEKVVEKTVQVPVKETVQVQVTAAVPPEKVTITFLSEQPSIAEADPLAALMNQFEEANPGVKIVRLTTAAGDDYFTKLVTMTAANNPPDIFYMPPWNLVYFKDENLLAPLDPYVAATGLNIDDVPEALVEAYSWEGVLLGLPVLGSILRIWAYNKDAFDEAGVSYPERYWTLDDFLTKAQAAMKRNGDDVEVWGVDPRLPDNAHLLPWLWTFGADYYNYPDLDKCVVDSPEGIQAMQTSVDLIRTYQIQAPPEIGPNDLGISFNTGTIAVSAIGTGQWIDPANPDQSAWPFKWGLVDMPEVKETRGLIHSTGMSVSAKSAHRDKAWELMAFLMSQESQSQYSKQAGKIAGLKSVGAQYAFADLPQEDQKVIADVMEYAWGRVHWRTAVWGKDSTNSQQLWQAMWLGEMTAEEACKQAARESNEMLAEALKGS